jgi:hypothetical protein
MPWLKKGLPWSLYRLRCRRSAWEIVDAVAKTSVIHTPVRRTVKPVPATVAAFPRTEAGIDYARRVLAGDIPACQLVHRACSRFLADLKAAAGKSSRWEWRPDLVERALAFAGHMRNIKGPEANKPLRIMPWQAFVFCNVFGWVERGTTTRRYRQAIVYVPRGNGKTTIAAPIALYLTFFDGEGGAEGYAAAVTRDQARILFDTAREMVRRSPAAARRTASPPANAIARTSSVSNFRPVSSRREGTRRPERAMRGPRRNRLASDERSL